MYKSLSLFAADVFFFNLLFFVSCIKFNQRDLFTHSPLDEFSDLPSIQLLLSIVHNPYGVQFLSSSYFENVSLPGKYKKGVWFGLFSHDNEISSRNVTWLRMIQVSSSLPWIDAHSD